MRSRETDRCPKCGADAREREAIKGFGGHETEVCKRCGHVFESRRMEGDAK